VQDYLPWGPVWNTSSTTKTSESVFLYQFLDCSAASLIAYIVHREPQILGRTGVAMLGCLAPLYKPLVKAQCSNCLFALYKSAGDPGEVSKAWDWCENDDTISVTLSLAGYMYLHTRKPMIRRQPPKPQRRREQASSLCTLIDLIFRRLLLSLVVSKAACRVPDYGWE
jgi:hypothetical protein